MTTSRATLALRYTPIGATGNTTTQWIVNMLHAAMVSGTIDIPDGTSDETAFEVPFGSVDSASGLFLHNTSNAEIGIRFQELDADEFSLPPDGMILISMPAPAEDTPLTAASVVTTGEQSGDGSVVFAVFGDTPSE